MSPPLSVMKFLRTVQIVLASATLFAHGFAVPSKSGGLEQHGHRDSALVAFYKKVYEADSSPDALTFEEAISPDGIFYTNGISYDYNTYNAISKQFNRAYKNVKISYSQIVEVPKVNGTNGEGTVGASVHWQGDYVKGGHDEFHSHAIIYIERMNVKRMATRVFEISDYQDTRGVLSL